MPDRPLLRTCESLPGIGLCSQHALPQPSSRYNGWVPKWRPIHRVAERSTPHSLSALARLRTAALGIQSAG